MVSSTEDTTAVCWQGTLKMKRDQASITSPVPPQSETVFTQGNCSEASVCGIAWNLEKIRQQKQCKKNKKPTDTYSIFWIQCSCPTTLQNHESSSHGAIFLRQTMSIDACRIGFRSQLFRVISSLPLASRLWMAMDQESHRALPCPASSQSAMWGRISVSLSRFNGLAKQGRTGEPKSKTTPNKSD